MKKGGVLSWQKTSIAAIRQATSITARTRRMLRAKMRKTAVTAQIAQTARTAATAQTAPTVRTAATAQTAPTASKRTEGGCESIQKRNLQRGDTSILEVVSFLRLQLIGKAKITEKIDMLAECTYDKN